MHRIVMPAPRQYQFQPRHPGWALLGFVAASSAAGAIGGLATASSVGNWYVTLNKPDWTPPGWLFGPVWSVLYLLMAVAAWLVWRQVGWQRPLKLFAAQLLLNALWSFAFFGAQNPLLGLIVIVMLEIAIIATMRSFWRSAPLAGWLMLPYLCWVSFAGVLNLAIWRLNL